MLLRSVVGEVVLSSVDDVRLDVKMLIDVVTGKLNTCWVEPGAWRSSRTNGCPSVYMLLVVVKLLLALSACVSSYYLVNRGFQLTITYLTAYRMTPNTYA